ncbi:MAG: hypothetical protein IT236_07875, partial [Bacteroidia bacterium]|nr:hypothetical protein [Bacteroidia bacterium]
ETLLAPVYGATPFTGAAYSAIKTSITDFLGNTATPGGPSYLGIQYVYDFLRDLINAYNEFRSFAFELLENCFQNMDDFPAHLMLGEFDVLNTDTPPAFRQFQSTSPLLNNQNIKADAAIFYHKRIVVMINHFDFALINDIDNYNSSALLKNVRITPEQDATSRLSKSAIPYYYKINQTFTRTFSSQTYFSAKLVELWNYNNKLKRLAATQEIFPAAYENQDYSGGIKWINKTPLYYNTDSADQFRIEGHLGSNYALVKTELEALKTNFGLPINFITLRLGGNSETDFSTIYNFDDLRTEYGSLRTQLIALVDNLLVAFPLVNGATTPRTFIPTLIETTISQYYDKTVDNGSIDLPEFGSVSNPERSWNNMKLSFNTNFDAFITLITTLKGSTKLPYNLASMDIGYSDSGTAGDGFIQCYINCLNAAIAAKKDLNQLLDLVVRNWNSLYNTHFFTVFSTYINEKLRWVDNFISDTKYKAIIQVHYKYRYRITTLKLHDPELLSNFVKKHPGIEHTGTVKKGGTFILVRNGGTTDVVLRGYSIKPQQVLADFSLPYLASTEVNTNSIVPETNDATGFTLPSSGTSILTFPALTIPLYYNYRLGDYAFAPDKTISKVAAGFVSVDLEFSIIPELIYDPALAGIDGTNIYLYLFEENGDRVDRTIPIDDDGEKSTLNTTNYCNPRDGGGGMSTSIAKVKRTGGIDTIIYTPMGGVESFGVDSFHYMFEIVASDGTVLARSGMGQITVNIDYHPAP